MVKKEHDEIQSFPCLNRDLSWVDFNERVMVEGLRKDLPLLERFRFLAIVLSNFDEFFMVRVAAIKRILPRDADKLQGKLQFAGDLSWVSAAQQLKTIRDKVHSIIKSHYDCLLHEIFPGLAKNGLTLLRPDSWSVPQLDFLEAYFTKEVYPVLTPLRLEDDKPLPFIESRALIAAFLLVPEKQDASGAGEAVQEDLKVIVPLPSALNRIIWLPALESVAANDKGKERFQFALLEDLMLIWGVYLFSGYRVKESMLFKINRDADFSVDEQRDEDFIEAMVEVLEGRGNSDVVRMVYTPGSDRLRDYLAHHFSIDSNDLYKVPGPINIIDILGITNAAGLEELNEKPWKIHNSSEFSDEAPVWDRISQGDVMLHMPYQSFDPVVRFFQEAASDPQVLSIKTALYRTGGAIPGTGLTSSASAYSPVVRALEQAALNGKHVTAIVELKARFDEERNISWANRLEKAGVIVIYGLSRLKVHAKVSLVLRRENDRIKRYVHLSTGNYNDRTARHYEDICLFTCREDIAYDAGLLFNMLTGYSSTQNMMTLINAPQNLKRRLLELIERETSRAKNKYPARIMAKLNSLVDVDMINALYRASCAGVKISLCVRGICALIPGLPGVSENIRVISVIDHYLEHSRIIYFANGGAEELYLSSADWMPRNLERRVELMFPVQDEKIRAELLGILNDYFRDNCQAHVLKKDGKWTRLKPEAGEEPFRVQKKMLSRAARAGDIASPVKQEYKVRRSPQYKE